MGVGALPGFTTVPQKLIAIVDTSSPMDTSLAVRRPSVHNLYLWQHLVHALSK